MQRWVRRAQAGARTGDAGDLLRRLVLSAVVLLLLSLGRHARGLHAPSTGCWTADCAQSTGAEQRGDLRQVLRSPPLAGCRQETRCTTTRESSSMYTKGHTLSCSSRLARADLKALTSTSRASYMLVTFFRLLSSLAARFFSAVICLRISACTPCPPVFQTLAAQVGARAVLSHVPGCVKLSKHSPCDIGASQAVRAVCGAPFLGSSAPPHPESRPEGWRAATSATAAAAFASAAVQHLMLLRPVACGWAVLCLISAAICSTSVLVGAGTHSRLHTRHS